MHCLLVFRKITFMIHLNFSKLAGIIHPLFDEIALHGDSTIVSNIKFSTFTASWYLLNFFREKKRCSHFSHSMHVAPHDACWLSFSSLHVSRIRYTLRSLFSCMLHYMMLVEFPSRLHHFSHKLQLHGHSSCMVGNIMFDEFPSLSHHFSH